jgi:hypothetical protein
LLLEKLPDNPARIRQTYRRTLGRNPTARERQIILNFLANEKDPAKAWPQIFHGLYASLDFRFLN